MSAIAGMMSRLYTTLKLSDFDKKIVSLAGQPLNFEQVQNISILIEQHLAQLKTLFQESDSPDMGLHVKTLEILKINIDFLKTLAAQGNHVYIHERFLEVMRFEIVNGHHQKTKLQEGYSGEIVLRSTETSIPHYVVKRLKEGLKKDSTQDKNNLSETLCLPRLSHKNIIAFLGLNEAKEMLLEYADQGDLYQYLNPDAKIEQGECFKIAAEILEGICYLHELGVVHRDLKLENILLVGSVAKIADFGFAYFLEKDQEYVELPEFKGTLSYMAPEYFQKFINQKEVMIVSRELDIWAYGIILFTMMSWQDMLRHLLFSLTKSSSYQFGLKHSDYKDLLKCSEQGLEQLILKMVDNSSKNVNSARFAKNEVAVLCEIIIQCLKINRSFRPSAQKIMGDYFC